MQLEILNRHFVSYITKSHDSIRHDIKVIDRDFFDDYRIVDYIKNKKSKQVLIIDFITPNLIRKSKRIITLTYHIDPKKSITDTLSVDQCDSILKIWGMSDRIYHRPKVKE